MLKQLLRSGEANVPSSRNHSSCCLFSPTVHGTDLLEGYRTDHRHNTGTSTANGGEYATRHRQGTRDELVQVPSRTESSQMVGPRGEQPVTEVARRHFRFCKRHVTIAVDETLERRWGPHIRKCGHWRDSRSSSKRLHVSSRGLRGSSLPWWFMCPGPSMNWLFPF